MHRDAGGAERARLRIEGRRRQVFILPYLCIYLFIYPCIRLFRFIYLTRNDQQSGGLVCQRKLPRWGGMGEWAREMMHERLHSFICSFKFS